MKSFLRGMRPWSMVILATIVLPFAARAAFASSASRVCDLPQELQTEIAKKYPVARVVQISDLGQDDRKFFQADHKNACPGLVKVDFYGDGKLTVAVLLVAKPGPKGNTQLVVAHEVGGMWGIKALDTGSPSPYAPVIWSQPPGKYTDVDNGKTIRANRPVIVFCGYEGWAIVYAWGGKKVDKVWIMD